MSTDDLIRVVNDPIGDEPHVRARERAAQELLESADVSHPRVRAAVERAPTPAVVELLGRFGRGEDVPVLAALLAAELLTVRQAAARALAGHPAREAFDALLTALGSTSSDAAAAAADGLLGRGDPGACAPLLAAMARPEPRVRYHAAQAALGLGCLDHDAVEALRRDPDLRALVERQAPPSG